MTRVKICGLTRLEDVAYVNEAMPDYAGFVFAESKRRVCYEQAKELKSELSNGIQSVGVFVNAKISDIEGLCRKNIIDLIQLHGDENEDYIQEVKRFNLPVIKAIRIKSTTAAVQTPADYELFDTYSRGVYGGTGETFDWVYIKGYKKPFFLAGGLDMDNLSRAIRETRPYCVDISSGVEVNGFKDRNKIIETVKIVRSVSANE